MLGHEREMNPVAEYMPQIEGGLETPESAPEHEHRGPCVHCLVPRSRSPFPMLRTLLSSSLTLFTRRSRPAVDQSPRTDPAWPRRFHGNTA